MESGDEDDAFTMGEREWQKMERDMSKQGYRDGKNEGREKGRQETFEQATTLAFRHSLKLGQILGMIQWALTKTSGEESRKEKLEHVQKQVMEQLERVKGTGSGSEMEQENAIFLEKLVSQVDPSLAALISQKIV